MMTLHTAKGLEYPYVFLTGMEQGTFPHQRAMEDTSELAEERRLAYVGITRAKRRLYVTRAAVRAQWGQASDMMPSQFLDEIPDELIDWKRREAGVERMHASWQDDDDEFGGWDDDDDFGSMSFGGSSYGKSDYGSSYGSGSRWSRSSYGSSSYGAGRSQYGGPATQLIILVWFHIPALVRRIGNRFLIRLVWFVWLRQVRREIGQGHHATCQAEKQACGFN